MLYYINDDKRITRETALELVATVRIKLWYKEHILWLDFRGKNPKKSWLLKQEEFLYKLVHWDKGV